MRAAVWLLLFVVSTISVAHAQGGAVPVPPYQNHPDMPEFWTPEYRAERNRELKATQESQQPRDAEAISSTGIPTGLAIAALPAGEADAAWCFDNVARNNKMIKDKSMKKGTCFPMLKEMPWAAVLRERHLGKFAIAATCYGRDVNISGFPVGRMAAFTALMLCQCHSPSGQAALVANRARVEAALKRWAGCEQG